jgi:hypothetical protein
MLASLDGKEQVERSEVQEIRQTFTARRQFARTCLMNSNTFQRLHKRSASSAMSRGKSRDIQTAQVAPSEIKVWRERTMQEIATEKDIAGARPPRPMGLVPSNTLPGEEAV